MTNETRIKWKRNRKQKEAWRYLNDRSTEEVLYGGGTRGGKTFLGCAWIITSSIRNSGIRSLIGRAVLKDLKQTTLESFFQISAMWNVRADEDYVYNAQSSEINFANGSQIHLKDLYQYPSDPEFQSLGSSEYTYAFIDEAGQITEKARNIVRSRLCYKHKELDLTPKLLMSCNPSKNFLHREFYLPYRDGTLPPERKFVPALLDDNIENVGETYRKTLMSLDKTTRERLLFGNWEYDDDPSKLFSFELICDLFTNTGMLGDNCLSCDVARKNDKIVIGFWEGLQLKKIYWRDCKIQPMQTDDLAKWLIELEQRHRVRRSNVVIDDDGIGGGVTALLRGCYCFINGSSPIVTTMLKADGSELENYSNLKTQCTYLLLRAAERGEVGITCEDPAVKQWITEELEQIRRDKIDSDAKIKLVGKDIIKERLGRSPDFSDTLMMRMALTLKRNPGIYLV